jgi:hypothetical protein
MVHLNRLLDGLDIQVAPFAICEVRAGAGLVLENAKSAHIHYVLEGSGMVRSTQGPDLTLTPHTVVVIPAGVRATILCHGSRELAFLNLAASLFLAVGTGSRSVKVRPSWWSCESGRHAP